MKRSHRDRLIASLPADLQAGVLGALNSYSTDGNSMVEAIFAALVETNQRNASILNEKLAASERREKELAARLAQAHAENLKTIRLEIGAISGDRLWKRIITSRIIGGVIWTTMVVGLTTYLVDHQIRTVDPKFHEQIAAIDTKIDAQAQRVRKTQDSLEKGFETTGPVTSHTIVGENLARYITSVDRDVITLTVPDQRNIDGVASFRVQHNMTEAEYKKLNATYLITKQFK